MSFIPRTACIVLLMKRGEAARDSTGSGDSVFFSAARGRRIFVLHVTIDEALEVLGDVLAFERHGFDTVDENRRYGILSGTGKADADVRVLALAGAVHDTAHHGDVHVLDAGVRDAPDRHLLSQVSLDA